MNKKTYLKKTTMEIPIYGGILMIVLTNSYEEILKKIDPIFGREYVYGHALHLSYKGKETFCIVLNPEIIKDDIHSTIAHEALHTVNFLCMSRGIKHDMDNDEPQAYLIGWVSDMVYKFLKKHKKLKA